MGLNERSSNVDKTKENGGLNLLHFINITIYAFKQHFCTNRRLINEIYIYCMVISPFSHLPIIIYHSPVGLTFTEASSVVLIAFKYYSFTDALTVCLMKFNYKLLAVKLQQTNSPNIGGRQIFKKTTTPAEEALIEVKDIQENGE